MQVAYPMSSFVLGCTVSLEKSNFIKRYKDEDGNTVVIFPHFHQLRAVRKLRGMVRNEVKAVSAFVPSVVATEHCSRYAAMQTKAASLTGRSNVMGYARRKETLRQTFRGWLEYFKYADMKKLLNQLGRWYRRRLRMCIWKCWRKARPRFVNLQKCGIPKGKAWEWANTRKDIGTYQKVVSFIWHYEKSCLSKRTILYWNLFTTKCT